MEVAISLLILGGLALLVMRFGSGRTKRQNKADSRSYARKSAQTPKPFDASKATGLSGQRIEQGAAFVTDGDTIIINKTQIRLFGIDAPELDHPYGQKAKWAMVKLCKGHIVRAEVTDEDDYGRTVAHCTLPDGRDLSAEMVKLGLALDWPKYSGGKYTAIEPAGLRKKLWLADARQKGRMHVWEKYEAKRRGD